MKPIETLDELKKELMNEHGAVYKEERIRYQGYIMQVYSYARKKWWDDNSWSPLIILDLENWYYYEKPKKIVREEIEGFVSEKDVMYHMYHNKHSSIDFHTYSEKPWTTKAKLIIEREVEE